VVQVRALDFQGMGKSSAMGQGPTHTIRPGILRCRPIAASFHRLFLGGLLPAPRKSASVFFRTLACVLFADAGGSGSQLIVYLTALSLHSGAGGIADLDPDLFSLPIKSNSCARSCSKDAETTCLFLKDLDERKT
jgi:hypothetical protein